MKSKFFEEVTRIAIENGLEDGGVKNGLLCLLVNGEPAAKVDESGSVLYTPYEEVFSILGKIEEARRRIPEVEFAEEDGPKKQFGQMQQ